jgi:hypothetical protein
MSKMLLMLLERTHILLEFAEHEVTATVTPIPPIRVLYKD